ncbi:hypothetical protein AMTR_s00145p00093630 [Amborella trichopoda]|uniref:Uncharacterized protein n=1 Tax=Amborella trichopoda TaxID=13333 RepID=W1PDC7_AMBTC|nr:hypothetical protein AMTR_s00145p00093630 [Amborella trichopoda]
MSFVEDGSWSRILEYGLVPSGPFCLLGVQSVRSKAVREMLRVVEPEHNLVHPVMMADCEGLC